MKAREYKAEDSVGVKNLILSVLEKEYPFDKTVYKDTDINDISGTYSGEGNTFFVIEDHGKIVGSVGIKKETDDSALIRRLFVDQKYRRKGFGVELLQKAMLFCKQKGYKEIIFRATDRMKEALCLLKKFNFSEKEDLEVTGFHIHKFVFNIK